MNIRDEFDEIRAEFKEIAESYLREGGSELVPIPHLKDSQLIQLMSLLFAEQVEQKVRRESWIRPRVNDFMKRFDQLVGTGAPSAQYAVAKRWKDELSPVRERLYAEYEQQCELDYRRRRLKDQLFYAGMVLGVLLLGAIIGLSRAEILPVWMGIVAFVAFVAGYLVLNS